MPIIPQKKNKRYNYTPRYYKGESSPYEMKHKFDNYRTTIGTNDGIKKRFATAWDEFKNSPDKAVNRRVLIIVLALVLVFLFIIDFDLSIFF